MPLAPVNLLLDLAELDELLRRELESRGDPLDAFLLAAGISQILDDHLGRDLWSLRRGADAFRSLGRARLARPVAAGAGAGIRLRARAPRERLLRARAREVAALVGDLADAVVAGAPVHATPVDLSCASPALRREVQRLPNCFRGFDQAPEDCGRLVELFARDGRDPRTPLLVLGLRTSGSYLAPLCAAFLRAAGYTDVLTLTHRPGQPLAGVRRGELAERLVLLVDDPPRSGNVLERAARELERLGAPRRSIVLLVPTFADALPERLHGREAFLLPAERWAVRDRLCPEAVRATLSELLGRDVAAVREDALAAPARGHVRAVFAVETEEGERRVLAEGVGAGYFGRHALAVAEQLSDYVPQVLGLRHGLLWREWLPDDWRREPGPEAVAAYALARRERLRVTDDRSARLDGREALWELAAAMLARCFGKAAPLVRVASGTAVRRMLEAPEPSVVDGSMSSRHWFASPNRAGAVRKVAFAEGAFAASGFGVACYDAAFDVAAAVEESSYGSAALREAWYAATGAGVGRERWLAYRLAHAWVALQRSRERGDPQGIIEGERALARAQQEWAAATFLSGCDPAPAGPLCALDIDGVLETRWLGFPAIGPDGALALRMLLRHGLRPVLATGRSVDEVRERCGTYGLAGGVAEYGAVLYIEATGACRPLVSGAGEAALDDVRAVLAQRAGVTVDREYRHSVRAYRFRPDGSRTGLEREDVEAALAGGGVRAIPGDFQTDFQVAEIDKAVGLRALADELGAPVEFAAGDSAADLEMLSLARAAAAPSGADPELRGIARFATRPYQAGLLEAVASFVGHGPDGCSVCAPPPLAAHERLVALALRAKDAGRAAKARDALRFARLAATIPTA